VGILELVVPGERETDPLGATLLAALANELPTRAVMRVDVGREGADSAIHFSKEPGHDTLLKSRLR
jgi:hypothetical protein